jgi:hypothetical protein
MGLAILNGWVHDKRDRCKISDEFWFAAVTHCNGSLVKWCGHTCGGEGAKCGHVEFQLPLGCYIIRAFQWNPHQPIPVFYFSNHAIVVIGCDQVACVHLFNPTIRQWPHGAAMAVRFLAESEKFPADRLKSLVAASDALRKDMPETAVDTVRTGWCSIWQIFCARIHLIKLSEDEITRWLLDDHKPVIPHQLAKRRCNVNQAPSWEHITVFVNSCS